MLSFSVSVIVIEIIRALCARFGTKYWTSLRAGPQAQCNQEDDPDSVSWRIFRCLLSTIAIAVAPSSSIAYEYTPSSWAGCWTKPLPESIEAAFVRAENSYNFNVRKKRARTYEPALLALSSESFRTPYSAGLIVGWGETGRRPNYQIVTGVGLSALIAPFAFIGAEGDERLANVFTCSASSWKELAEHAAGLIDSEVLESIARRHDAGARLLVALPGSAARPETVWDLGAIASSRRVDAGKLIGDILVASVSLEAFIDPASFPIPVGFVAKRNFTFRAIGAGEPFLEPPRGRYASYSLILGGVLVPSESAAYIAARSHHDGSDETSHSLVAAYDLQSEALSTHAAFQFTSAPFEPSYEDVPEKLFDMDFTRRLFLKTYWVGVQGGAWQPAIPGTQTSPH